VLQNFDLGPSLVDEVMKAFGGPSKAERLEKSPARNRNADEKSSTVTAPSHPEDLTIVSPLEDVAHEEAFVSAEHGDCSELPDVQTPVVENDNNLCPVDDAESLKSYQVLEILSDSSLTVQTTVADTKCNGDVEREDAVCKIWQQQQQQQIRLNKSEKPPPESLGRKNSDDAASSSAGGRHPAVVRICSLSPRPVCPREPAFPALADAKRCPSSTVTSSSEERIPVMSSRVAASLVAASSSSLPARSSLVRDSWSKLPHLPGTKVPSTDSSDSESGNLLQRLKDKASLSRLSAFRLSVDSRTPKSRLPTQNLNTNFHFFERLREQELQNSIQDEDDEAKPKPTALPDGDSNTRASSTPDTSRHLPSLRIDTTRRNQVSQPRISGNQETDSSGVESGSGGTDGTSPIFSSHDEVARLSCRSTESHDSSHDSEHSSTTTQPSDEGVYSDESAAASTDELRPKRTASGRCASVAPKAVKLGFADKDDVFWSCPINFRDFVNVEESCFRNSRSQVGERYSLRADLCYEDRMECELNGCVDMCRYSELILLYIFHFI